MFDMDDREQVEGNKPESAGMGGGGQRECKFSQVDRLFKTGTEGGESGAKKRCSSVQMRRMGGGCKDTEGEWKQNIPIFFDNGGAWFSLGVTLAMKPKFGAVPERGLNTITS